VLKSDLRKQKQKHIQGKENTSYIKDRKNILHLLF